jgi:TonB-dependent receptor
MRSKALVIGSAMLATTAMAQQAQEAELEEIVVTGLRGSLKASLDTKRDAVGVVDAITAEDIGKFPDTNLSEALQRITGVSISRNNGEGSQVTARGFGAAFNMVTLNGRQMPAADAFGGGGGQSRAFNFANLAAESVSGVEVYKTSKANIATGGIGAVINIKTAKPFDRSAGFNGSVGIKAISDTTAIDGSNLTPELSGIFSYVDDNRVWGVSLSASSQLRESGDAGASIVAWDNPTKWVTPGQPGAMNLAPGQTVTNPPPVGAYYSLPSDLRYFASDTKRNRTNGQLTVQFQPTDRLLLTADYTYAENKLENRRSEASAWFSRGGYSGVTFDSNPDIRTPTTLSELNSGKDNSFAQALTKQTNTLKSLGFNVDFQVNDSFSLAFDLHDSNMKSLPNGPGGTGRVEFGMATPIGVLQSFTFNSGLPIMNYTINDAVQPAGQGGGNGNGVVDERDLGSQIGTLQYADQVTDLTQARIDGELEFDNGRFQFGLDTRSLEMRQKSSDAIRRTMGGWGAANTNEIPDALLDPFCILCQFDDYSTAGAAPAGFRGDAWSLLNWAASKYGFSPSINPNLAGEGYVANNKLEEDTKSVYFQVGLDGELGGRAVNVLAGARYETTKVKSTAFFVQPTQVEWQSNNDFQILRGTGATPYAQEAKYNHLLPNFDFDIELVEDVKGRFSYSKTIARAEYGQLTSTVNVNAPGGTTLAGALPPTANGNNPALVPLESDNFDLSLEWYFGDDSYLSAGFFEKRVSNFIGSQVSNESLYGLRDPTSGPRALAAQAAVLASAAHTAGTPVSETELFSMMAILANPAAFPTGAAAFNGTLTQANALEAAYNLYANSSDPLYLFQTNRIVNNKAAKLHGFELGGQYFFGDTGFGVQANYTIVRGDVEFDNAGDPAVNQFALPGLSDSANVILMYEKYDWTARLAWNWRDEFLADTNGITPTYVEAYKQWDLGVGYEINDNLSVSFEGINLTGEDGRSHGRSVLQLQNLTEQGARYGLGARYKF